MGLSEGSDVVFTSGGIGPTHDDVTLRGVARALGMEMERNTIMMDMIIARYKAAGRDLSPEVLEKMSTLPSGALLRLPPDDPDAWPVVQCANVFVLPGIP